MTINFLLGKCKTKAAFSAKLRQKGKINLVKIKEKYDVVLETPILLVINVKGIEIIVHSHGELLFKNCFALELMEKLTKEIYETGLVEK